MSQTDPSAPTLDPYQDEYTARLNRIDKLAKFMDGQYTIPGTPIKFGSEFLANTITTGFQGAPVVTGLADGRFVVSWTASSPTDGDTEVIPRAYAEWGEDCPRYLQGVFAFAIWDMRAQQLFMARDRFGVYGKRRPGCCIRRRHTH